MIRKRHSALEIQRARQIDALSHVELDGAPVTILGSLGHAAALGMALPPVIKRDGSIRDIDIYIHADRDKTSVEEALKERSLDTPSPLDAGGNNLIEHQANGIYLTRGEVAVELKGAALLEELEEYPVRGHEGVRLRSLTPLGMLALHKAEPIERVLFHKRTDARFTSWFENEGLALPKELNDSIEEFHRAHNERYPHAALLRHLSKAYVHAVPEQIRVHTRSLTHQFMRRHSGRRTPITDQEEAE